MSWTIREFTPDDYEGLSKVHNAVYTSYPVLADDFRRMDRLKEEKVFRRRWVAELDGEIVGIGYVGNSGWAYHPRKFEIEAWVKSEARGKGIGTVLYDTAFAAIKEFEPIVLRLSVREDWDRDLKFVAARGFERVQREQESRLDIAAFDPAAFASEGERAEKLGIQLRSWSELSDGPDAERKYHALSTAVGSDVPYPDPLTETPFEVWRKRMFESPRFIPDCNIIALDGDQWVGMSNMWKEEVEGRVETGLTGVLRSHRKKGIASALKVRSIEKAKQLGFTQTITWNEENNTGMLGINIRLGFKMEIGWIELEKVLDAEAYAESLKDKKSSAAS